MVPFLPAAIVVQRVDEFRRFGLNKIVAIWDGLVGQRAATTDCKRKTKAGSRTKLRK